MKKEPSTTSTVDDTHETPLERLMRQLIEDGRAKGIEVVVRDASNKAEYVATFPLKSRSIHSFARSGDKDDSQ